MERYLPGIRRKLHKQAKRKAKRWEKAFAALETPISLILAVDEDHPVPLHFLPLLKAKQRIEELNLIVASSGVESDEVMATTPAPEEGGDGVSFIPARPPVLRDKTPIDLDRFWEFYSYGERTFRVLLERGRIKPAAGKNWSVLARHDLERALPTVNLRHMRRRDWYVILAARNQAGEVVSIQAWSMTWKPMFERRV